MGHQPVEESGAFYDGVGVVVIWWSRYCGTEERVYLFCVGEKGVMGRRDHI